MLSIKQREKIWVLGIKEESWNFKTKKEMDDTLKILLTLKEKHGHNIEH